VRTEGDRGFGATDDGVSQAERGESVPTGNAAGGAGEGEVFDRVGQGLGSDECSSEHYCGRPEIVSKLPGVVMWRVMTLLSFLVPGWCIWGAP